MVQYVYNNAENKKIGMTPFFTNYGHNPQIKEPRKGQTVSIGAMNSVKALRGLHKRLQEDAEFYAMSIGDYYDRKHEDVPPWKEGDKVYLC